MDRRSFLGSAAGVAFFPGMPKSALAATTTQLALFDALPRPRAGQWVRLIMGSGVDYQKQIGLGTEAGPSGELYYVETQIGSPGGSCNPNTMKRVYLEKTRFRSLLSQEPVLANVANSGTTLTRWGDVGDGQTQTPADARLRLLDAAYLYDDRPCRVVSVAKATLRLPGGTFATTHTVAEFSGPADARHSLRRIELWTTPALPFGVAKYRAISSSEDPFELHLYSHGIAFKPELNMSLNTIRAITPDGTHVQTS